MNNNLSYAICLVDDDEMYLQALKHKLEGSDEMFKVHTCRTGEDCLEHLFTSTPDAVVLDYYLNEKEPGSMTGIHVLAQIMEVKKTIPVIILSAQKNLDIAVNCIKSGASDYIVKNEESAFRLKQGLTNLVSAKDRERKMKLYEAWNVITAGVLLVFLTSMVIYAYQHG